MTDARRCAAAHVEDPSPCDGAPRAVRVADQEGGEVTGCVRHGAALLASLDGGRVHPGPDAGEGDVIAAFTLAQTLAAVSGVDRTVTPEGKASILAQLDQLQNAVRDRDGTASLAILRGMEATGNGDVAAALARSLTAQGVRRSMDKPEPGE